jgi:hypothetical protein
MTHAETPVCVIHFDEEGNQDFHICGEARLLVIDERAPNDRVYEMTRKIDAAELAAMIGGNPIGSINDERHAAVSAVIMARLNGKKHLRVVDGVEAPEG